MTVLAIDPGPEQSAYVVFDGVSVLRFGKVPNREILEVLADEWYVRDQPVLVIEQIAAMGMAVGAEVFETVFWSGRFSECYSIIGGTWDRVKRHEVKTHLCGSMRAKDPNVRQALLDRFGPGKEKAVGTKKAPGPLYGVSGDVWAALAVAVTWWDTRRS